VRRFYNLPSLTALAAFEAAARHRSMTRAADELNVTIGAVSRQIRALEAFTGDALLDRGRRGVGLTAKGTELYAVLSDGFSRISQTMDRIKAARPSAAITLGATTAVASLWLMKRVGDFWRAHPDVTINHLVSDDANDLRRAEVDLRVRYGSGTWPDEDATLLFRDYLVPVCGPEFRRQHRQSSVAALARLPLLRMEQVDPSWTSWEEWFALVGHPAGTVHGWQANSYAAILNAAADNLGVALGWSGLVAPLLQNGTLVRFGRTQVLAPGAFYLTWNRHRRLSAAAELLKRWLIAAGPATPLRAPDQA